MVSFDFKPSLFNYHQGRKVHDAITEICSRKPIRQMPASCIGKKHFAPIIFNNQPTYRQVFGKQLELKIPTFACLDFE